MAYQESAVRREQLIAAAVRVICQHGVTKATTRRIAHEANVNLGTLHYVFDSKEDLFAAVALECMQPQGAMDDVLALPARSGLRGGFVELLKGFRRSVVSDPDLSIAQYELLCWAMRSEEMSHLPKRVTEEYISAYKAQFDRLATSRERDVDTGVLARYAYMIVDGMYFQHLTIDSGVADHELAPLADSMIRLARKV